MKVAITGASGFLGRYVLKELQSRDVDIVDARRSTASDGDDAHPRIKRVHWDLADAKGSYDRMGRPDLLIHLAWDGLPNYQSERHVDTELPMQAHFLRTCIADGLERLAVAGTCFEYGLAEGELDEESPVMPVTKYGLAKHRLYEELAALAATGAVELTWGRFFYLYGEGQASSSLYRQLMEAIEKQLPAFNMSGGEQRRDFQPAAEAARLFTIVALGASAGAVNICSGHPISVSSLVEQWVAELNATIALNKGHYPYSTFEPMAFWGSRAKLDAILHTLPNPAA
jgi:dTDP-6-deoxy-L-talose 4-dehydrogenase (NAD+)